MLLLSLLLALSLTTIGSWTVNSAVDAFNDSTRCQMSSVQDGGVSVMAVSGVGDVRALVLFNHLMKGKNGRAEIRFRFDSDSPQTETWTLSANSKMAFAAHPEAFVNRLRTADRLAVQAFDLGRTMQTLTFEFEGNDRAFELFEACVGG